MKEELQSKLVEILSSIQATAGSAKDFALTQLPDVAQSYVVYGRIQSIASVLVAMVLVWFAWWLTRRMYIGVRKQDWDDVVWLPGGFLVAICGFVGSGIFICGVQEALLVWFAPKVWLIKELAQMVK